MTTLDFSDRARNAIVAMSPRRTIRNAAVAALSALLVLGLLTYATATPAEQLYASVGIAYSASGQHVRGKAVDENGAPLSGGVAEISHRVRGKQVVIATSRIGASGHFAFAHRFASGTYRVVVQRQNLLVGVVVKLKPSTSIFVLVQRRKINGHSILGPVIFNY